ncbi:MAG: insulinase family protein [Chitinophagaceae bacterium]|nr:insulinase family protein [Chitinophagaceae bacterium]
MRKLFLLLSCVVLVAIQSIAQSKNAVQSVIPQFITSVEGVKEYSLPNGLQILLVPDAAQTNVIVNIVYRVGSRNEGYGETGMAHLLEHMLFKGTKKFASIKQTIANKGAAANGTTWYDRTNYFEILPATDSNLTWALEMEADRMVNSLMRKEDLQKEFSVVRNEFEAGENSPGDILMERVISAMYLWHNYGKSTIGSKEDIERVPIENLTAFYKKYYQPDNATLIIGGKFDEKKTLAWIAKYFSGIPKPKRVIQQPYTVEPPQDGGRFVELSRNGDIKHLGLGYHTPCYSDKDYVANNAVIEILTNDPSGVFYKALVEPKLATKVFGLSPQLYDPGYTYFGFDIPVDKNIDSAKNALMACANGLPALSITETDLERAKNALSKRVFNVQNNTVSFCISLTEVIGAGNWKLFYINRDRLEKLTLADVQAVLAKYYRPSNSTYGFFIPDKNAEKDRVTVSATPDIAALVNGYKGKAVAEQTEGFDASIANIKRLTRYGTLSNGLKYALLQKPVKGDKINARITLKVGDEQSLTGKSMISQLTARMLKTGTVTKSKKEINDLLDKLKTSLNISGSNQSVSVSMSTDKENYTAALDLLVDILLHPVFDKNEFDKLILDVKGEYESNQTNPQYLASNALSKKLSLYPKGHPLYPESIDEALATLKTVTLDDLKNFYQHFYGANNGYATFVGAIDNNAIQSFLEKNLSGFSSRQAYKEIEEKYFDVKGSTEAINVSDKKNAFCVGAINLPVKETSDDFPALDIANELLGGGAFLSSRIPNRLRETDGMSYGAGSYLSPNYKYAASSWGVYAIFNPVYKNRLDSALHEEISKALTSGFKEDEFSKSRDSWLQMRKTNLGFDGYLSYLLSSYMQNEKDLDYFTEYENKVKKVTLADVNAAMKKYLQPGKITLIYAGDFDKK